MIIKLLSANLPIDFPKTFPFSKDIDIICAREDFEEIISRSIAFVNKKCMGYYDEPRIIRENSTRCRIRIELEGYLIFQIDLCCSPKGLSDKFVNDSLSRRIKQYNYYIPCKSDEICFRINEFIAYPWKTQHLEYVRNHVTDVDKDLVAQSISGARQVLEKIIGEY